MSTSSFPRPLVVGAGIGGLAVAIASRRAGGSPVVLERRPAPSFRGSGLVLSPNGLRAARMICPSLPDSIRAAGVVSGAIDQTGHRSSFVTEQGRPIATVSFDGAEARWGAPIVSLTRARLHRVLLEQAHDLGVEVRVGQRVAHVEIGEHGVAARSVSGEELTGDLLIGADGVHSFVRTAILDDGPARYAGFAAIRGLGPRPADHPDGFIAYGRGTVLFSAPVDHDQLYWVASIGVSEGTVKHWSGAEARSELLRRMTDWAPSLRGVVEASDPADWAHTDVHDRAPVKTWHRGRGVLLGDAAHPMVYTLGQGANQALEDAAVLTAELSTAESVEQALLAYEQARSSRVAQVTRMSRMLGRAAHLEHPWLRWLRNTMMRWTMSSSSNESNDWLFDWSGPGVPGGAA